MILDLDEDPLTSLQFNQSASVGNHPLMLSHLQSYNPHRIDRIKRRSSSDFKCFKCCSQFPNLVNHFLDQKRFDRWIIVVDHRLGLKMRILWVLYRSYSWRYSLVHEFFNWICHCLNNPVDDFLGTIVVVDAGVFGRDIKSLKLVDGYHN